MSAPAFVTPDHAESTRSAPAGIRTIVVPIDGGYLAERALMTAIELGTLLGARVHPVFVHLQLPPNIDVPLTEDSAENIERRRIDDDRAYVKNLERRLRQQSSRPTPVTMLRSRAAMSAFGEPAMIAQSLERFVADRKADMVVMSSHGSGGMSRVWLGSVTDLLIRRLGIPVMVIRAARTGMTAAFKHVLVPVDGSTWSEEILPVAVALARTGDARLTVLHVQEKDERKRYIVPISVDENVRARMLSRRLAELATRMPDLKLARVAVVTGKTAARAILKYAVANDVDCIAMTTRGRSGPARLVLGSVADKVVRSSPCATVVMNLVPVRNASRK